ADYFGEEGVARTCSACDNCLSGREDKEEAVDPLIVSAALAAVEKFHLGAANVAAILAGADTKWVRDHGWVLETPSHGALRGWSVERLRTLLGELVDTGLARLSPGDYPTLLLTDEGKAALRGTLVPELSLAPAVATVGSRRRGSSRGAPSAVAASVVEGADAVLMERLRVWRSELARSQQVPAYVILTDRSLAILSTQRPRDAAGLLGVPGIGQAKLERYGAELLRLLAE
ncbi:MAG: HRDC domain-containing protein, partial [Candidatus Dormibacteraceae bacterium]